APDSMGTTSMVDDMVPAFSAAAKTGSARKPDFVAPGVHIQGLRVPNSYIDTRAGVTLLDDRFMRGSGTSESAAITSGAAALLLDRWPNATPDQIKNALRSAAVDLPLCGSSRRMGAGELQLPSLLACPLGLAPPTTQGGST